MVMMVLWSAQFTRVYIQTVLTLLGETAGMVVEEGKHGGLIGMRSY